MPAPGYRDFGRTGYEGVARNVGNNGYSWSSSVSGSNGFYLNFNTTNLNPSNANNRGHGFQVRCLQHLSTASPRGSFPVRCGIPDRIGPVSRNGREFRRHTRTNGRFRSPGWHIGKGSFGRKGYYFVPNSFWAIVCGRSTEVRT